MNATLRATSLAVLAGFAAFGCASTPLRPKPAPVLCVPVHAAEVTGRQELRGLAESELRPIGVLGENVFVEGVASIAEGTVPTLPDDEDVKRAVVEVTRARLLDDHRLQYSQILNDCEDRAAVTAAYLLTMRPGWVVGKVFVRGEHALSTAGELVHWRYHVAPFVLARKDGKRVLRVIDPAFHNGAGLGLAEWLGHFADAKKVTVILRAATGLNDVPVQGEDDLPFCKQADLAMNRLREYLYKDEASAKLWARDRLKIDRLEGSRVWFVKDGDRTGWFLANDAHLPLLEEAKRSGAEVNVRYNAVERGILRGRFLYLVDVARAPSGSD